MSRLEEIIAAGTPVRDKRNWIKCVDGFKMSVIANWGAYCTPRPAFPSIPTMSGHEVEADYPGPFTAVEVGYPSQCPEPWEDWAEFCESPESPTETVYGYVPVGMVRALVALHGGEVGSADTPED